jgi:hypothetical protein
MAVADNNKLRIWELKNQLTTTLKLWEKNLKDLYSTEGQYSIKSKLIAESTEMAGVKWIDVAPKMQVISAYEDQ